ncbi:unnamed protein product [Arabidopsis halleri]
MSGARVLASNEQDVSMAEVGQPPGDIPAVSSTWVEKVQGSGGGGLPVPEKVVDDEFVAAWMRGERYFVSYEGLNSICPSCGIYGHLVSACPQKASEAMAQMNVQNGASSSDGGDKTNDGFTVVKKAGRRVEPPVKTVTFAAGGSGKGQERNTAGIAQITGKGNVAISNSFSGLNEDLIEEELREGRISNEANKENIDVNIPQESRNLEPSRERYNLRKESRVQVESRVEVTGKKSAGPKTWKNIGPKKGPNRICPPEG